jgi:hypothetical protein
MESDEKTTFIPKKSLQDSLGTTSREYVKKRDTQGPGFHVALLTFALVLLTSGGVFLYTNILVKEITKQEAVLKQIHNQFDSMLIQKLVRNDHRLRGVTTVLKEHIAPSVLFAEIERITLKDVYFEKYSFIELPKQNTTEVAITGIANSFESVALQLQEFESHASFHVPRISVLEFTPEKLITFGIITEVDPDFIQFARGNEDEQTVGSNASSVAFDYKNPFTVMY